MHNNNVCALDLLLTRAANQRTLFQSFIDINQGFLQLPLAENIGENVVCNKTEKDKLDKGKYSFSIHLPKKIWGEANVIVVFIIFYF